MSRLSARFVLVVSAVLVLVIVACSESATPTPPPTATPTPTAIPTPTATPVATPTPTPLPGPKMGGNLKFVPIEDLFSLDMLPAGGWATGTHQLMIQDMLFALRADGEVAPQMVGEWTVSSDGLIYDITLRDGLKFHDGTPVTSEEAVLSTNRWASKAPAARSIFDPFVKEVVSVDDKSFRITLSEPIGLMLAKLATPGFPTAFVTTKEDALVPNTEHCDCRIGSGPFKLVDWKPGVSLVHERNSDYVPRDEAVDYLSGGKTVYLDRIEWQIIADPATRVAVLEAGEVDHVHNLTQELYSRLENNEKVRVVFDPVANTNYLIFNHLQPPFDNVLARRAVQVAVDQERYMRAMQPEPFWRTCLAIFGCDTTLESTVGAEGLMVGDLAKGTELLEQSGYDGRAIVLMGATEYTEILNASIVTNELLENIGATTDLVATDYGTMAQRGENMGPVAEGGWNIWHTWGPARGPLSTNLVNPTFSGWYESPRIEAFKVDYLRAPDLAAQKQALDEITRVFYEEAGRIALGEHFGYSAQSVDVQGFINSIIHPFWNVWLDR